MCSMMAIVQTACLKPRASARGALAPYEDETLLSRIRSAPLEKLRALAKIVTMEAHRSPDGGSDRSRPAKADRAAVAVVIVNYRTPELTMRCVASLAGERNRLPKLRAVVVDGGSQDGSSAVLEKALGGDEF